MYIAQAIDTCQEKAKKQLELFTKVLSKYNLKLLGAGIGESPIIKLDSSLLLKKVIVAYDLRKIREADVFLLITNLKDFCVGSMMELEYSRSLGLLTIVLCLSKEKPKNIFMETMVDKIIFSVEELEDILKEIVGVKKQWEIENIHIEKGVN